MNLDDLKKQYFEGVYKTKAFLIKETAFTLQSGAKSHLYCNHRNFLSQHIYLTLIANIYQYLAKQIPGEYQLGAVDSVTSPVIVGAMSTMFNMDYIVVRSEPLKHGTQDYIYGNISKPIVLIDDMTSTGGTLIDAAKKIRSRNGLVEYAIISACRDKLALKNLAGHGIKLLYIAEFTEILSYLNPILSKEKKEIVAEEMNSGFLLK